MGACKKSRQCQRLEMKMTKTLLFLAFAAFASALPLDVDRQCEGTLCHAGCCPMQGWYCCEDNMNCAATAEECPSLSSAKSLIQNDKAAGAKEQTAQLDVALKKIGSAAQISSGVPLWQKSARSRRIFPSSSKTNKYNL